MDNLISRKALCEYALNQKDKSVTPNDIMRFPSAQSDLDEWCTDCKEYDSEKNCCPRFNRVIRQAMKDAQLERKKGYWIRRIRRDLGPKLNDTIECSECGIAFSTENMIRRSFCPSCGARMDGDCYD